MQIENDLILFDLFNDSMQEATTTLLTLYGTFSRWMRLYSLKL